MKDALITVKPGFLDRSPQEVRASRISSLHREKLPAVKDYIGEAKSLREHILRLSLFPNIHNRSTVRMSD